jgi:hypothetical protein
MVCAEEHNPYPPTKKHNKELRILCFFGCCDVPKCVIYEVLAYYTTSIP